MKLAEIIKNQFDSKCNEGNEPAYAACCIEFSDNQERNDVTIKLSNEFDENDDAIFYYCESVEDLYALTTDGAEDFQVVEVYSFFN